VVDEAHHTTAGTWAKVIAHFSCKPSCWALQQHRYSGDGRGLGEHYQAMVQGPTAQQLTDNGFLAAAKVLAPPGFRLAAGLRKRMGDFDTKQAEQRVGTIMGDCLTHYRKHLSRPDGDRVLLQRGTCRGGGASVPVGNGIAAASIDGSMDTSTRRQLLADLGTGRLKVLTSCALIGEGVDVPSVGRLHPAATYGQRGAAPADDRSMLAPTTWQDCGSAGSCRQYAPAWPPPRGARLDA
jgi:DNA repair protein RadD